MASSSNPGRSVIVAYRPKPGQEQALRALVERHQPLLAAQHLATERPAWILCAADGTIIEIFEWRCADAIAAAHGNAAVQSLWEEFAAACDYVPLGSIAESARLFADFATLNT